MLRGEDEFIAVRVQVNVYSNATVTEAQANEVLDRANVVYLNAKANLHVYKVKYYNNERPPNGEHSRLTEADRRAIFKSALDSPTKKLALCFVEQPNINRLDAIGICLENGPVSIIKLSNHSDNIKRAGDTTAHEFGHSFGLDDINDPKNLMHERDSGSELGLTDAQRRTIKKNALPYHHPVKKKESKKEPAQTKPKSSGMSFHFNSTNPAAPDYLNVAIVSMASEDENPDFDVRIQLLGLMPVPGAAGLYRLLFDTDNNPGTGVVILGYPGIDKELRVNTFPSGDIMYRCRNIATNTFTSLSGTRKTCVEHQDYVVPSIDEDMAHAFEFSVPKTLLDLNGGRFYNVKVIVQQGLTIYDEFQFELDLSAEQAGPQLSTTTGQIGPGSFSVTLEGSQFEPNAEIKLMANRTVLATLYSDLNGTFTETVTIPSCTPGDVLYLFAVETISQDDAYTVVHRIPSACDANCDGVVNTADIPFFARVLLGLASPCSPCAGDINADGALDALDIKKFIEYLQD